MSNLRGSRQEIDASEFHFGIVAARFNEEYVDALLNDCLATLVRAGADKDSIKVLRVPGSAELAHVANLLANSGDFDAIIALGVIIKGDTPHHLILGNSVASALQNVALATQVPVVNGVIVANTLEQAKQRTTGDMRRGIEYAEVALEMAHLTNSFLDEYSSGE